MKRDRDGRRRRAAVCAAALLVLAVPMSVQAREIEQQAALAAASPTSMCIDKDDTAPATGIVACTVAIDAKTLKGRELATAHLNRGQAYRAVGDRDRAAADYGAAIKLFDEATSTASLDAGQFLQRGIAHHALDDVDRALSDYDEAIRLDTGNALAHVDRGILIATRKADMRRAIGDFDRALALMPDNIDKAIADLDQALALKPDHALASYNRGYAHFARQDYEKAIADYTNAIKADGRMAWAYNNRGTGLDARRRTPVHDLRGEVIRRQSVVSGPRAPATGSISGRGTAATARHAVSMSTSPGRL